MLTHGTTLRTLLLSIVSALLLAGCSGIGISQQPLLGEGGYGDSCSTCDRFHLDQSL